MSKLYKAQTQQGHSRHFFEYIRNIGESRSKQEEDDVVLRDLAELKKSLASANPDKRLLKEYVVRVFYAEMLGISAEFGYIQSVNLSSSADLRFKRVGYLGTWLTVSPEHDFMYLIVSNLQRDMKSSNFLDIDAALTAASKLVRPELMSAINTEVVGLLNHSQALVRKKVVRTMHAFYRKSDGLIGDQKLFRQALCDRDPSVMGAALRLFEDVIYADSDSQRDLVSTFVSILRQIIDHRLPREYDYHRIPAPWLQIQLLHILAMLIGNDVQLASQCEDILAEVIKRADNGLSIGYAVTCEAITTVTRIPTIPALIELAAEAISKFLSGMNANLRYVGIKALSQIVRVDPQYAREHQQVVMTCLEDADDTIKRKTITLLLAMCNADNVDTIISRLIKSLKQTTETYARQYIVRRICDAAQRFSPGPMWYIVTMNKLLTCAPEQVPQSAIQNMLKLIAEGEGEDDNKDVAFRTFCVETYFNLLEGSYKKMTEAFCRVAAWVIGEYGFLAKGISRTMLLDRLCDMLERAESTQSRGWIVMAMMKLVAHSTSMPDNVEDLVERLKDSRDVSLQQRCYEFFELVKVPVLMKKVLPLDGCCEEIDVDESMSFLDSIVQTALEKGARPYEKRTVRLGAREEETLRTDAYKVHRTDVVDERELDAAKFETGEPDKLVIRPSARRWGLQNLSEEAVAAAAGAVEPAGPEAPVSVVVVAGTYREDHYADGTVLHHADPMAPPGPSDPPARPNKNEKFLNDIFGGAALKKARRRDGEADPLRGSPQLHITAGATREAGATWLTVRLSPRAPVESVAVELQPPPGTACRDALCDAPGAEVSSARVAVPALSRAAEVRAAVVPVAFPSGGALRVGVHYRSAAQQHAQRAEKAVELSAADFLRPAVQMTTQQFGQAWVGLSGEAKVQLSAAVPLTPDVLQRLLEERASLRVVEVIRSEVIAAAVLLGTGRPLLCHVAVAGPNTANVTVRAEDKEFAGFVARAITGVT